MDRKYRILVVEDNPVNLELFADFLTLGGYECRRAANGEEALEAAKKEPPDLVLLDIQLPGLDGCAVARLLKSSEGMQQVKVIALTAYALKGDKELFLEKGFDGYIAKPIMMKEFLEAVEHYLRS
ncbi:MAG: response regulator [Nitrospirota bacterium]